MSRLITALALALIMTSHAAFAMNLTVKDYLERKNDEMHREIDELWITGLFAGIQMSDAWLALKQGRDRESKDRIYCPPAKLALTGDQLVSMIDQYISDHRPSSDDLISLVLIGALEEVFPCH